MSVRVPLIYQKGEIQFRIDSNAPQLAAIRSGKIQLHALTHGWYIGNRLKKNQLAGISSIGFWDGVGGQDWGLDPHRNEGLEICFLETGNMAFSVEGETFDIHSGHLTITRPWQLHKLGAPNIGPGRLHWLILDVGVRRPNQDWRWPRWLTLTDPDKEELTRKLRHNEQAVWVSPPTIDAVFSGLSDCVLKWESPHVESRMINLLNELFLELLTVLTTQPTDENEELEARRHTVRLFLNDLANNATSSSTAWTLEKMAFQCGMGVTAFSKYCRELVNCGPVEYLNHCRLDRAARQLRDNPAQPIIDIAFNNGFNSSQYFATVFRQRFRLTPRQYRTAKTV